MKRRGAVRWMSTLLLNLIMMHTSLARKIYWSDSYSCDELSSEVDPGDMLKIKLPDSCDDTIYYRCIFGVKVTFMCPNNLYFSPESNGCQDTPDKGIEKEENRTIRHHVHHKHKTEEVCGICPDNKAKMKEKTEAESITTDKYTKVQEEPCDEEENTEENHPGPTIKHKTKGRGKNDNGGNKTPHANGEDEKKKSDEDADDISEVRHNSNATEKQDHDKSQNKHKEGKIDDQEDDDNLKTEEEETGNNYKIFRRTSKSNDYDTAKSKVSVTNNENDESDNSKIKNKESKPKKAKHADLKSLLSTLGKIL